MITGEGKRSGERVHHRIQQKLVLYGRYGVREYWIVDVDNRTVDLWTSGESALDTRHVVAGDSAVQSSVLPGLVVSLAEVFAGVDAIPPG